MAIAYTIQSSGYCTFHCGHKGFIVGGGDPCCGFILGNLDMTKQLKFDKDGWGTDFRCPDCRWNNARAEMDIKYNRI